MQFENFKEGVALR